MIICVHLLHSKQEQRPITLSIYHRYKLNASLNRKVLSPRLKEEMEGACLRSSGREFQARGALLRLGFTCCRNIILLAVVEAKLNFALVGTGLWENGWLG